MYVGPDIVQDGLVAVFDAGSTRSYPGTGSTWYNLSTSSNGALSGASIGTTTAGTMTFDGVDDYVVIDPGDDFFINAWTWEMVVKFDNNSGTHQGLVWAEGSGTQYLITLYNYQYFHYRIQNSTTGWVNTDVNISFTPTDYNHIVWQFNNGTSKIYVNGQLLSTDTTRGSYNGSTARPVYVGSRNDLNYEFNGDMPMLNFYNSFLTQAQIAKNFNAVKSRFGL